MGRFLAAVLMAQLTACTLDVTVDATRLRCNGDSECPDGLPCTGGYCGGEDTLAMGLVAHYPMDTDSEVTDDQPDVVGGHTAVCPEHCPNLGVGVNATAACFDGNDILTIPSHADLHLPSGAISAWASYLPGNRQAIVARPTTENNDAWMLLVPGDDNTIWLELGGEPYKTPVDAVAAGQWVHVVGQWDDQGQAAIFVNGAEVWSGTHVGVPEVTGDAYIGADINDGVLTNYFTGCMDELRIYDRPLTSAEITELSTAP